ncbi:dTDP-4-dehydrorhamnose reductase [Dickeya sp. CFBP 2040]|uniref:dTDP-4-dehydrorhamnose reductase n=1 Tax=Dickeya sp. CFBP 2040 TaxID=2718531 RepID=UPI001445F9D3|nr:dTDP-4-dehydrorhamnose reductase [Dickeya sp. CFBP 2040]NKI72890.1 dTDP-4-dehydrorhamnose reductase [Dickeya sp. CFBP 2040]
MKVLIVGSNGQVGSCLVSQLLGKAHVLAVDREQLDITDKGAVFHTISQFRPDYIVNAAAHTAVDKAENEIELSYAINRDGPAYLAQAASEIDAVFLHISTDYVFDGESQTEYDESMPTAPHGIYGKSKLAGEHVVADLTEKFIILRTAWVFGEHGHNFVKTMLRLGATRDALNIVSDQVGGPTYAGDIAAALIKIISYIENGGKPGWGIYHFSGMPHVSWFDFAAQIFQKAKESNVLVSIPTLLPILTSAYPTPAKRPSNSRLNCEKIRKQFDIEPSNWQLALDNIQAYK